MQQIIKTAKELGKNNGRENRKYILRKCSWCKKENWVILYNTKRPNYTGICQKCRMSGGQTGKKHYNWKGGKYIDYLGYVRVRAVGHPLANKHGEVKEHRLIASQKWGIFAVMENIVHHKDGDKLNNTIENLELMSQGEHMTRHKEERALQA